MAVSRVCWFMRPLRTVDQRHNAGGRESIIINHHVPALNDDDDVGRQVIATR